MHGSDALESVAAQLRDATRFSSIFGAMPKDDKEAQQILLRKQFAFLAGLVHPDRHVGNGNEARAAAVFRDLNSINRKAKEAIEAGNYEKEFPQGSFLDDPGRTSSKGVQTEIRSHLHTYQLDSTAFKIGDFSLLYKGRTLDPAVSIDVLMKVASRPPFNSWIETESAILSRFRDAKKGSKLLDIKPFVPELLDMFFIPGPKGTRYAVSVLRFVPNLVSLSDIMRAFPKGLDPRDASWIFRRVITQTMAAKMAGVVHCGITPDHVLVDPVKHDPFHIGWAHAIEDPKKSGRRITQVIDRWRALYPPEVFKKVEPDHRTDLYMAGKTMIALLGGDITNNKIPSAVPHTVSKIILRAVEENPDRRYQTGQELLDDFTRVIRKEWGREYRPLVMPN